ncbi:MAG: NAD(P)-binding domain-containing protein [bacterium]|nr:NAD(P)-binding domain-containing protein [bacterium]
MADPAEGRALDLLVVGAGPTGIAIGARARQAGLDVVLVDRGPLAAALVDFPVYMNFFTTRDLMEIAGVPLTTPHDKPSRREALAYYRAVAAQFEIPLALNQEVVRLHKGGDAFEVVSRRSGEGSPERVWRARAVALAQGYFHRPRLLSKPGEEHAWVHCRYLEPYRHFGEHVAIVGGGNSALEAALDLWRNHVRVTVIHRGDSVKDTVKYWLKPDFENRVAEGSIEFRPSSIVRAFEQGGDGSRSLELETPAGVESLAVDAAYVLIGYEPDTGLARQCGVTFAEETLVPTFDRESCESNVEGLYLAGTIQAGRDIGTLFIENSRVHADRIVEHVVSRRKE